MDVLCGVSAAAGVSSNYGGMFSVIFLLLEDDVDDERSWLAWCCNLPMSSSDIVKFSPPVS